MKRNGNTTPKKPFTPTDKQTALFLSHIFPSYYQLIRLINSRYRTKDGLKPTNITYLLTLYPFPDGLTIEEVKEVLNKKSNPRAVMVRLMDLGYIERKKGKIRGSYNLTPDIYYLTLSGIAVVESILNAIRR